MRKYGWKKDSDDKRDLMYLPKEYLCIGDNITSIDLRPKCPNVYNQGNLGSCTANALAGAIEFELLLQNKDMWPSRLFIYYNERVIEDDINNDDGAQIRDGIKSVASQGVCDEKDWPYIESKFIDKPPDVCYTKAQEHKILNYYRIRNNDINAMIACLNEGYPFVFGFVAYKNFESRQVALTGILDMPGKDIIIGGHAVMCVGYDLYTKTFLIRNSWGEFWGKSGYFTMPFDYLADSNLSNDFWTIRMVE